MDKDTKSGTVMATASQKDANTGNLKFSVLFTATPRTPSVKITAREGEGGERERGDRGERGREREGERERERERESLVCIY